MEYGVVVAVDGLSALVLFENPDVQKKVKIPRHIQELQIGEKVAVAFETQLTKGVIIGVVDYG